MVVVGQNMEVVEYLKKPTKYILIHGISFNIFLFTIIGGCICCEGGKVVGPVCIPGGLLSEYDLSSE